MIAIDDPNGETLAERIRTSLGLSPEEVFVLTGDEQGTRGAEILVVNILDKERFAQRSSPELRWVHSLSTGVDGFPMETLVGQVLTCSRGASATAISEYVLGSILLFEKRLSEIFISGPAEWKSMRLGQLKGKTLGLIGFGGIGTAVAKRAIAFEMEVVAFRRTSAPTLLEAVRMTSSIDDVLASADHLVIAAPATPETHHMIDEKAFSIMRPGVHLVNISRGTLVDQEALLAALDKEIVAFATLDVTDPEPLTESHPLYSHERVRVSPHVSWSSPETFDIILGFFLENVERYTSGMDLVGVVDPLAGY